MAWRQDLSDPYRFHLRVPDGVTFLLASYELLQVRSDVQSEETKRTSVHVATVEPSDVVLYPTDKPTHDLTHYRDDSSARELESGNSTAGDLIKGSIAQWPGHHL